MGDGFFGFRRKDLRSRSFEKPSPGHVCILFSTVVLLFIVLGFRVQRYEFYSGILITEFVLVMLPALAYLLFSGYDLKFVLRLNKTGLLNFFLVFSIMLFALPVASVFNLANLWLVNAIFGRVIVAQPPIAEEPLGLLLNLLVIGGSAGLCEEFLFRGVVQRGFERFGAARSVLMAAFLFSLIHLDFQKIFGTFILGALIGFIVYRTNSLYAGMLAHFTNNSLAVVLSYAMLKLSKTMQGSGLSITEAEPDLGRLSDMISQMPRMSLIIIAFFYGAVFLVIVMVLICLLYAFIRNTRGKAEAIGKSQTGAASGRLLWVIPGLVLIFGVYFLQVMQFRGIESPLMDSIRTLLGV